MNLIERVKKIILSPAAEWKIIKEEDHMISDLFTQYALKLAAIPAISGLVGFTLFGYSYGFGSFRPPLSANLKWAISMYVMSIVGVYILAYIIDVLAPTFGSKKHLPTSMKVVVFAYTAAWVGGIFNLIPAFAILGAVANIYSLVLLYKGLQIVKEVPKNKMAGYFVAVILASLIVYGITGTFINSIAFGGRPLMPI
ncbi:MAG: Yip1 family protein [Candidatus Neomarinimicrobiota bacterium]